jgi:hypothetical protein
MATIVSAEFQPLQRKRNAILSEHRFRMLRVDRGLSKREVSDRLEGYSGHFSLDLGSQARLGLSSGMLAMVFPIKILQSRLINIMPIQ